MNLKKLHDDSLKRDLHRTRKNKTGNLLGTQGVSSDVPEDNLTDVFNEMDTKEGIDSSYKKDLKKQFGDSADTIDMKLKNIRDSRKSLIERYNDSAKSLKKLILDYKNKRVDSKCISDAVKKHNEIVDSLKSIIKDAAGYIDPQEKMAELKTLKDRLPQYEISIWCPGRLPFAELARTYKAKGERKPSRHVIYKIDATASNQYGIHIGNELRASKFFNTLDDAISYIENNPVKDDAGSFQEATSDEPVVDTNIESPEAASTSLVDSKVTDSYDSELTEKAIKVFSNKFSIEAIKRKLDKELCPTFRLLMGNLIVSVNRTDPKHSDDSQELMVEINNEEVLEPSQFFSYEEDKQASEIQACALDYVKNNEWAIEMIADIYDLYDNIE